MKYKKSFAYIVIIIPHLLCGVDLKAEIEVGSQCLSQTLWPQLPDTVSPELKQVLPNKNEDYSLYKLDSELSHLSSIKTKR